jgi:single-strand selective monofunctional uracil DNA glycosylase
VVISTLTTLIRAARELAAAVDRLTFGPPVTHVYNPLRYAGAAHREYIRRYASGPRPVVFLGMNPGPWGMAQTGVPFGDVETVRDWLRIRAPIAQPSGQHPRRPVLGLDTTRVEVSGRRLWGLMRARFGTAASFFRRHFVANYCPLLFLHGDGSNRTPDKLPAAERQALFVPCDRHLAAVVRALEVRWLVGVGGFAHRRATAVIAAFDLAPARAVLIPHPSPASPLANTGWAEMAEESLTACGVWRHGSP